MSAPTSLLEMFSIESVLPDLDSRGKPDAIREMVQCAVKGGRLPRTRLQQAVDAILAREERGSTGLGKSIAIPHAKLPGLRKHAGVIARSVDGLDFRAVDGEPVYVLVMMISPESRSQEHLDSLKWVSALARDPDFCSFIRQARSAEQIFEVLQERAG